MIMNLRGSGGKRLTLQSKSATPGTSDIILTPDEGYDALSNVVVGGSSNLMSSNIKSGYNIFGVSGSLSYKYQSKSVTPGASSTTVYPDSGYTGLSSVTVSGSSNLTASNIKYGKSIFGVTGTYEHTTTATYNGPTILSGSVSATTKCNAATVTSSSTLYKSGSASGTATTVTATIGEISGNTTYSFSGGSGTSGSSRSYVPTDYSFYVPDGGGTSTSVTLTGSCTLPNGTYKGSVVATGCTSSGIAGCTSDINLSCSSISVSGGTAKATVSVSHSIGGNTGGTGWKSSVSGTMTFTVAFQVTSKTA